MTAFARVRRPGRPDAAEAACPDCGPRSDAGDERQGDDDADDGREADHLPATVPGTGSVTRPMVTVAGATPDGVGSVTSGSGRVSELDWWTSTATA